MKVKVGNRIYDGEEEPVMVILERGDRENIENMPPEYKKYCMYPDTYSTEEIKEWMKTDE